MKHNWQYKKLGEICDKGSTNLMQKNLELEEEGFEVFGASGSLGRIGFYQQEHPYVGIVKDGSGVGRCNIYPAKSSLLGTMQYILAKDCVSNAFLCYLLKSLDLSKYVNGAAIPHIYFRDYKKEIVPLPPLEEQQRIVAELDRINAVMEDCRQLLRTLDALAQSLFYDSFGDPISNPKAWPTQPLKDVTICITDGDHMAPPKSNDGIPFITISNINKDNNSIDFSDTFFVPHNYYDSLPEYRKPIKGDVLYTVTGSYGIPVLIDFERQFCFQRHIGLIRPKKNLDSIFLAQWCNTKSIKAVADRVANGIAQKTVSLNSLRKFPIILPPLELQQQFARRIEAIEAQKKAVEKTIATLQTLLDSRMDYWFN